MNNQTECLICKSSNTKKNKAQCADFILERVFDGQNKDLDLLHCQDCGFAFFSYRFNDEECQKLYTGYRGKKYQQQRQKHECWYTDKINDLIGKNETEIKNRNANLTKILKDNTDISKIKSVLDFGGDKGQFIPQILNNAQKYVYDISGVEVVEGVMRINSIEDCSKNDYDLIICSNVLEHVSDPAEIIKQIKSLLHKGKYLYLELPFDSPFYKNQLSDLQFLFNRYFNWINILKHFIKTKKYANISLMHEHINFYTPQSIETLLQNQGFKILHNKHKIINFKWGYFKIISTLCVLES